MAANAPPEVSSGNPCCLAWQGKYMGMKKRRDYCKEAIDILQKAISVANDEKANLEKKLREIAENKGIKDDDSAVKASLEKEISDLKSEMLSWQQRLERNQKERIQEVQILRDQASSREKEINELKNLLKKETLRPDNSEEERENLFKELNKAKSLIVKNEDIKPHVPEVEKELTMVKNLLASERQKNESERMKAKSDKKKADQYLSELALLRTTSHKTSSDLLTLTSNLETVKKQLEFEKQKTAKERKRADMESAKAREQVKLAEDISKKFEITSARNEELTKEAELERAINKEKFAENSVKLEEKIRLLEMNKKTAMDWKCRADDLTKQLREAQSVAEGYKNQLHKLSPSQKSTETFSVSARDLEKAKMKHMKKKLKFERKCAELSERVANFEKLQREFIAEEMGRLKLQFGSFTSRTSVLNEYISNDVKGTAGLGKTKGRNNLQMLESQKKQKKQKKRNGEKHSDARCQLVASSGSQDQTRKLSAHLIPRSGHGVSESASGTISQLESPTGGSGKLQTSGVISSETSFSDGQLLASQGREHFAVTTAEIAKDKPIIQPAKSNMFQNIDTRKSGNLSLVAENCRPSHEVINEHSKKRRRMSETVKSHKHMSPDGKKTSSQIVEKLGTLQSMVVETKYRHVEEKETLVPDMRRGSSANCINNSKKRKVSCEKKTSMQNSLEFKQSAKTPPGNKAGTTRVAGKTMSLSTAKGHDPATFILEGVAVTDYMKLLELDKPEEENYYKMARESLLSPDLPRVDFLDVEIANEDKNPASALYLVVSDSVNLCDTINSGEAPSLNTQNGSMTVKMLPESTGSYGSILNHFVVFSNIEDQNSVIKTVHAANNCVQRSPSITRAQWAVPAILFSLKMEENLLAKERACVFVSLLLHNFSMVSSMNDDICSCLDSFSKHIYGVMADIEAGGMVSEFLEELLSLLQDLLFEQRVLYYAKHSETSESDVSIPVTLNGENVALFSRIALTDHLVAGSAILAAICTSPDHVGFIREACFEILYKHRQEKTSVALTILHVFAYVAGEKLISFSDHDISIAVLKSIVMFLEKMRSDTVEGNAKLHLGKNKCPFSDRSSPLETVASKLMELLQEFTRPDNLHQSLTEFRPSHQDFQCVLARDQSVTLCDILSLLELIASYTTWDWTSANIVAPLLKMLRKPLPMNLSVAIVSLLGQLSSIGVDASGYEDDALSSLREKLSSFLKCETTLKAGFAVQIATVSSLLKTLGLDFATVLQGKTATLLVCSIQSLSGSVGLVNKWYSLLSDEQQVFASEFLRQTI
ncbi:unnamed protein product [Cochlearia groenlandica]